MGRMPYHIHVFPYRRAGGGEQVALFERADLPGTWQGVSGGGEAGESVLDAARRECREEAAILRPGPLYPLDSLSVMRSTVFPAELERWGPDVLVLPMYFFAMPYAGRIALSEEHLQYRWCSFEAGDALVRWPDQNTALWELARRLERGNLERPTPAWMSRPWRPRQG